MRVVLVPRTHIWPEAKPEQIERLREAGAAEVTVPADRRELLEAVRDADVLIGEIDPEILEHAGRLRWFQALASGVDSFLFPEFVESDIVLTSEKGLVGPHLADHAFGLLLALTRSIAWAAREKTWETRLAMRQTNRELSGMVAGIVGLGGTGVAVAERAAAFGMRCLAVDPEPVDMPSTVEWLSTPDRLVEMASRCDVLFVCCPKTKETIDLIDGQVLGAMPPGGYVVNVTRGGIINEDALIDATRSGHLAGAGLDVTAEEPLPAGHPLWALDNVIITPHTAGASQHRVERIIGRVCRNLGHLQRGEPLEGIIDKRKGY
jgi:phosphoglycerate dehydrogenase-like enzyme